MAAFFSFTEARRLLRLGIPIYIAQMSNMGMGFVDTVMTGQASSADMAAVALASALWAPVSLFGVGVLLALTPLSAQCVGAGQSQKTAHILRQGLVCNIVLSVPLMLFFVYISYQMEYFGVEPVLAALAGRYLRAVLWGLPALFLFINIRSFLEGFSRTRPAMLIAIIGLCINVPLNYIFIYGKLGLPALGAVGCGIATAICFWVMALAILYYVRRDTTSRAWAPLFTPLFMPSAGKKRVDWFTVQRIFRIGLPNAFALLFEVSLFALTALLLAPLGTITVAGHQIAMNMAALLFMMPLSIGITATIRVGHCTGAGTWDAARQTAWTAMSVGLFCAVLNALFTILFRQNIVAMYSSDAAVTALAAHLLWYAAAFQVVDAVQAVGMGILRGYNDTRMISRVCFVAYWLLGLPLGYTLAYSSFFGQAWGVTGFWLAYLVGLGFGALCYVARIVYIHGLTPEMLQKRMRR